VPGSFQKKAWFGATGSDASDCCARLLPMATGRRRLISYVGAYHGTTSGSASLSGHQAQAAVIGGGQVTKVPYPDPYRCLFGPCDRAGCSLRCLEYVERYALGATSPAGDTAAVIMEAVQSDGGEVVPPANYIPALRELCDEHGIWLVFDEVKIGLGRTGKWFGFEHAGVTADAVILGKPLGGGLPLSAVVGRAELLDAPTYSLFTLGGSPLPCAAGLATLEVVEEERLLDNAARMGERLLGGLLEIQKGSRLIGDVRGRGLILGVELVADRQTREPAPLDTHRLVYRLFELGLLTIYSGLYGNVVEITPPLTIRAGEVDEALSIIERALADVEAGRFDDAKLAPFAGW
jgi:4-aminobutyrate aminotransferase